MRFLATLLLLAGVGTFVAAATARTETVRLIGFLLAAGLAVTGALTAWEWAVSVS